MSLEPIGFWSYTREDDVRSRGRLSQLRLLLADELQGHIGRAERVRIFQDVATIPYGATWAAEIDAALDGCSFFIPIVTPGFLQSEWCCREVMGFRQREIALGRNDLIFPIRWIDVEEVDPDRPGSLYDRAVWDCLRSRQQIDFRHLRLLPPDSTVEVALKVEQVARAIVAALRRPVAVAVRSERAAPTPQPATVATPDVLVPPAPTPTARNEAPPPHAGRGADDDAIQLSPASVPTRPWWRPALWVGASAIALGLAVAVILHQPPSPPAQQHATAPAAFPTPAATAPPPSSAPVVAVPSPPPPPAPLPAPLAAPVPGSVIRDCPTCPEMVLIPHGNFTMGVPDAESKREGTEGPDSDARPTHPVAIARDFYLGKYTVTKAEYAAFVAKTGPRPAGACWTYEADKDGKWSWSSKTDRDWRNPGFTQTDRDPVVCVSAADADAYADWLSHETGKPYRLPSEAEWEYAARAGTKTARFWGDGPEAACRYANVADTTLKQKIGSPPGFIFFACDDHVAFTAPVGSFAANGFGLYDMLGNAWQWTADSYHSNYDSAPGDGSAWITAGDAARRVLRGGSWYGYPRDVRAGYRDLVEPGARDYGVGFRLARTLSPP